MKTHTISKWDLDISKEPLEKVIYKLIDTINSMIYDLRESDTMVRFLLKYNKIDTDKYLYKIKNCHSEDDLNALIREIKITTLIEDDSTNI